MKSVYRNICVTSVALAEQGERDVKRKEVFFKGGGGAVGICDLYGSQ